MTKYLITGVAGFLGRALAERLLIEGHEIVGLDNYSRYGVPQLSKMPPYPIIKADVRDMDWVQHMKEVQDVEAIIHLAAINGTANFYERPWEVLEVGTLGIFSIISFARNRSCRLFVASSSEVYQTVGGKASETVPLTIPDPHNPRYSYAASKIVSELAVLHSGIPSIIFRPHNVYGPGAGDKHVIPTFIQKALATDTTFPIMGDALATRAFTYIDDFIDGLMLVLKKGKLGEIYHIGTEEEKTIVEIAMKILKLVGKEDVKFIMDPNAAKGGPPRRCPDITKLRQLGFSPKITLDEGLKKTLDWYRAQAS